MTSCDLKSRRFWRKPLRTTPELAPLPTSSASDQCGRPGLEMPRDSFHDGPPGFKWRPAGLQYVTLSRLPRGEKERLARGRPVGTQAASRRAGGGYKQKKPTLRSKCSEGGRSQVGFFVIHVLLTNIIKTTPGVSKGCCNRAEILRGDSRKTGPISASIRGWEVEWTAGPAWKRRAADLTVCAVHVYHVAGSVDAGPSGALGSGATESSHREPAPHAVLDRVCF